jgi:hypothetical protein
MNASLIVAESRTFEGRQFPVYRAADGRLLFDPQDVMTAIEYKSRISQLIQNCKLREGEDYVLPTGAALTALNEIMRCGLSAPSKVAEGLDRSLSATEGLDRSLSATEGLDRSLSARRRGHRNRYTMLTSTGVARVCQYARTPKAKAFRETVIGKLGEQLEASAIPTHELPEVAATAETQIIRTEPVVGTVETEHDTAKKAMMYSALQLAQTPTPAQCNAFAAVSREHRLREKERQQRNDGVAEEFERLRKTLPGLTDKQLWALNLAESRARCAIALEEFGADLFEQALQTETTAPAEPVQEPVRVWLSPTEIAERWVHADGTPVSNTEVGRVISSIYGPPVLRKADDAEGLYCWPETLETGRRVLCWAYAEPALGKIEVKMLALGYIRRDSIVPA